MAYDKSTSERRPSLDTILNRLYDLAESENIAADLEDDELGRIGQRVKEEFEIDLTSRSGWEETAKKSMDIALQVKQQKNFPFEKSANVKWPLITVAALQFNARCYPAIVNDDGIVKATVIGDDNGVPQMDEAGQPAVDPQTGEPVWQVEPGAKQEKADRISEHMSYQLKEEMDGWEEDMDTLTIQLPIVGDVVKKIYRGDDGNVSEMIPAIDFVVNQKTKSLKKCPRATHIVRFYPYEIEERKADGRWLDVEIEADLGSENDKDAPIEFLEQHRRIDLDGDGYGEPYIVTVHRESGKTVRIVPNFTSESVKDNGKRITKIVPDEYFVNYTFIPDPKGGFYGIGFGSLLESMNQTIDTLINQMIDAATLQNAGGGFMGSGIRLKKGVIRRELGKWITVDAPGGKLREAMVPFEDKGPSQVSFALLEMMLAAATDITAVKDIFTGESGEKGVQTATTTLALIEQGMKVFTAIYKRIYRSLRQEFKLLFRLNAEFLDEQSYFRVLDTPKAIARSDYDASAYDVCPVADPKLVTDMQRLARAQALIATIELNPGAAPEILKRYYMALGVEDVELLLPQPAPPDPMQVAALDAELANTEADTAKKQAEAEKTQVDALATAAEVEMQAQQQEMDAAGMVIGQANTEADRALQAEQAKVKEAA